MTARFTHNPVPFKEIVAHMKNGQRFYDCPNGLYPSITTVLGAMSDKKEILEGWRKSLGPAKADKETKRAADRGTALHLICERYIQNDEAYERDQTYDNLKLFNQIKIRVNKINNILGQEIPLYSELLEVAGRCDLIAEYEGVLSIIDFKTSNGMKDDKMIEDYFLQCTAYSIMFEEMFDIVIEDIVIIIAVEKGMNGLVFKRKRADYIPLLIKKAKAFHAKQK